MVNDLVGQRVTFSVAHYNDIEGVVMGVNKREVAEPYVVVREDNGTEWKVHHRRLRFVEAE